VQVSLQKEIDVVKVLVEPAAALDLIHQLQKIYSWHDQEREWRKVVTEELISLAFSANCPMTADAIKTVSRCLVVQGREPSHSGLRSISGLSSSSIR
jgi:hypothetical protein